MQISASAFSSGVSALQAGQRRVDQAAADIAANTQGSSPLQTPAQNQVSAAPQDEAGNRPDLAQSLVALQVGKAEAQAGAKLVRTADEVLGTLLDITA